MPKVRTINRKRRSVSVGQYGKWMKVGLGFGGWAVPHLADSTRRIRLKGYFFNFSIMRKRSGIEFLAFRGAVTMKRKVSN